MALAEELWRAEDRVEVEDLRMCAVSRRKHMATVSETNLATVLHLEVFVFVERAREDIHQVELVTHRC